MACSGRGPLPTKSLVTGGPDPSRLRLIKLENSAKKEVPTAGSHTQSKIPRFRKTLPATPTRNGNDLSFASARDVSFTRLTRGLLRG